MASPHKCKIEIEFDGKSIKTLVTSKSSEIDEWIRDTYALLNGNGAVIGLCILCKSPVMNNMGSNKAATLQLCMDSKCIIIQLLHLDQIPVSLKSFMLDPCFTFVGMGIGVDIFCILADDYGLFCSRFEYVHDLGRRIYPSMYISNFKPSLIELARTSELTCMERIPMEIFMSNWEATVLNLDQIKYGCIYAYAFHKIGLKLLNISWSSDCGSRGC